MRIKKVTIEGMHKVTKKSYDFGNVTYLMGPNGSGKSTVMQAIQLGLLGYIPGMGKNSKESIFRHANCPAMTITLEIDDNGQKIFVRRIWAGAGSTINASFEIDPTTYNLEKIVESIELPIFNFSDFLGMTANKLKDWFINFLPSYDVEVNWEEEMLNAAKAKGITSILDPNLVSSSIEAIKSADCNTGLDRIRKANDYFKSGLSFKKGELQRIQGTIQSLVFYDDYSEELSIPQIRQELARYDNLRREELARAQTIERNDEYRRRLLPLIDLETSVEEDAYYKELIQLNKKIDDRIREINSTLYSVEDNKLTCEIAMRQQDEIINGGGVCPYTHASCVPISELVEESKSKKARLLKTYTECDSKIKKLKDELNFLNESRETNSAEISGVVHKYKEKDLLESQIVPVDESGYHPPLDEIDSQIRQLNDWLTKALANERYSKMIDKLTSDKFTVEQTIELYKIWDKLTGVNGLQSSGGGESPFVRFASDMDTYIPLLFGSNVKSEFNITAKANSFSFGINRDGKYISYDMLSSGEKCMYMISLMICIVNQSRSQLKLVMVDDMLDHLDDNNIDQVIKSVESVEDIQFIFAGVKSVCREVADKYAITL